MDCVFSDLSWKTFVRLQSCTGVSQHRPKGRQILVNADPETFGSGLSVLKIRSQPPFRVIVIQHAETTWTQQRFSISLCCNRGGTEVGVLVLHLLNSFVFLLSKDLARSATEWEKKVALKDHKAKLQVRLSWISKNISLQMRMETLPKQSSKFLAAWLGPGLSITWIHRSQWEGLCLYVLPEQPTGLMQILPPKAQLQSHGAMACKSIPGIHWPGEAKACAVCCLA